MAQASSAQTHHYQIYLNNGVSTFANKQTNTFISDGPGKIQTQAHACK